MNDVSDNTGAAPVFDASRADLLSKDQFEPFSVTKTVPLLDALEKGHVDKDTPLLVFQREGKTVALLAVQMSHHHVAQGDISGKPWMVSF